MSKNYHNVEFEFPGQSDNEFYGNKKSVNEPIEDDVQEKEITWFWLMQHYSKKNAELYKEQKAAKKAKKEKQAPVQPVKEVVEKKPVPEEVYPKREVVDPEYYDRPNSDGEFGKTVRISHKKKILCRAELECISYGQNVPISKSPYRIGRSKQDVELCIIDNEAISHHHADIICEKGHYYIVDLHSMNHTYVNDVEIQPGYKKELHNNDKIELADEEFIFHII